MSSKGKGKASSLTNGKDKRKRKNNNNSDDDEDDKAKRRNRAVLQFFEDSAVEADDCDSDFADEDGFDDISDFIDDFDSVPNIKSEPGTAEPTQVFPKEEELSGDELEKALEERYRRGSKFVRYADDGYDGNGFGDRGFLIPSVLEPTIWKVKCKFGRERHAVCCLMQKYVDLKELGTKLQIISAFAVEHIKGSVFVEAEKASDVTEACKQLSDIYSFVTRVPANEVSQLMVVRKRHTEVKEGAWARVKSGIYRGDIAQVVGVNNDRKRATVKLIPRIDLQALAAKYGGGEVVKKRSAVPAARLISPRDLEEFQPLIQHRRDRDTGKVFEFLDSLMLKDGFLYKKVPFDSLSFWNVNPSEDELLKFSLPSNNETDNSEWLAQLYGERKKTCDTNISKGGGKGEGSSGSNEQSSFEVHDLVVFGKRDFGMVVGLEKDDNYKVLRYSSEGFETMTLGPKDLKYVPLEKKFRALDHHMKPITVNEKVKVVDGPAKGREGIVKQVYRGVIFLYDENDFDNAYFCARSQASEKVKHDSVCLGKDGGGPSGFEDAPSSPNSPLQSNKPWQRTENNYDERREKDGMFSVGQSLRIRVGPLKGYRCRVVAIRYSDVTVKLDSQQKVLTVKREHLSEVQSKSSVTSLSDGAGLSSSLYDFGAEGCSNDWSQGASKPVEGSGWNGGGSGESSGWATLSTPSAAPQAGTSSAGLQGSMDNDSQKENDAWASKAKSTPTSSWGAAGNDNQNSSWGTAGNDNQKTSSWGGVGNDKQNSSWPATGNDNQNSSWGAAGNDNQNSSWGAAGNSNQSSSWGAAKVEKAVGGSDKAGVQDTGNGGWGKSSDPTACGGWGSTKDRSGGHEGPNKVGGSGSDQAKEGTGGEADPWGGVIQSVEQSKDKAVDMWGKAAEGTSKPSESSWGNNAGTWGNINSSGGGSRWKSSSAAPESEGGGGWKTDNAVDWGKGSAINEGGSTWNNSWDKSKSSDDDQGYGGRGSGGRRGRGGNRGGRDQFGQGRGRSFGQGRPSSWGQDSQAEDDGTESGGKKNWSNNSGRDNNSWSKPSESNETSWGQPSSGAGANQSPGWAHGPATTSVRNTDGGGSKQQASWGKGESTDNGKSSWGNTLTGHGGDAVVKSDDPWVKDLGDKVTVAPSDDLWGKAVGRLGNSGADDSSGSKEWKGSTDVQKGDTKGWGTGGGGWASSQKEDAGSAWKSSGGWKNNGDDNQEKGSSWNRSGANDSWGQSKSFNSDNGFSEGRDSGGRRGGRGYDQSSRGRGRGRSFDRNQFNSNQDDSGSGWGNKGWSPGQGGSSWGNPSAGSEEPGRGFGGRRGRGGGFRGGRESGRGGRAWGADGRNDTGGQGGSSWGASPGASSWGADQKNDNAGQGGSSWKNEGQGGSSWGKGNPAGGSSWAADRKNDNAGQGGTSWKNEGHGGSSWGQGNSSGVSSWGADGENGNGGQGGTSWKNEGQGGSSWGKGNSSGGSSWGADGKNDNAGPGGTSWKSAGGSSWGADGKNDNAGQGGSSWGKGKSAGGSSWGADGNNDNADRGGMSWKNESQGGDKGKSAGGSSWGAEGKNDNAGQGGSSWKNDGQGGSSWGNSAGGSSWGADCKTDNAGRGGSSWNKLGNSTEEGGSSEKALEKGSKTAGGAGSWGSSLDKNEDAGGGGSSWGKPPSNGNNGEGGGWA